MDSILIVEPSIWYREKLKYLFENNGFSIDATASPIDAIVKISDSYYDIVLADSHLDDMKGISFLQCVKKMRPLAKTVILTEEPCEETELSALHAEVDLYLSKNKNKDLILQHIRALTGKKTASKKRLYSRKEDIVIDLQNYSVYHNGNEVEVTKKEFEILTLLLRHQNKVVTRDDMLELLWKEVRYEIDPHVISVHLSRIREKLKISSIVVVRGLGYKWIE